MLEVVSSLKVIPRDFYGVNVKTDHVLKPFTQNYQLELFHTKGFLVT